MQPVVLPAGGDPLRPHELLPVCQGGMGVGIMMRQRLRVAVAMVRAALSAAT
jgi:hypothetical protein